MSTFDSPSGSHHRAVVSAIRVLVGRYRLALPRIPVFQQVLGDLAVNEVVVRHQNTVARIGWSILRVEGHTSFSYRIAAWAEAKPAS